MYGESSSNSLSDLDLQCNKSYTEKCAHCVCVSGFVAAH